MARFALENREDGSWFVCVAERGESIDSFSLGMLRNNSIPGLPGPVKTEENGSAVLMYPLGKKRPVQELFRKPADRNTVMSIMEQFAETLQEADRYMLPEDGFLLQPRMMFADPDTMELSMIYLPLTGFRNKLTAVKCLRRLLGNGIYLESEETSYVAGILNLLNREKEFSARVFGEQLRILKDRQR